jgi:hypothetical protein
MCPGGMCLRIATSGVLLRSWWWSFGCAWRLSDCQLYCACYSASEYVERIKRRIPKSGADMLSGFLFHNSAFSRALHCSACRGPLQQPAPLYREKNPFYITHGGVCLTKESFLAPVLANEAGKMGLWIELIRSIKICVLGLTERQLTAFICFTRRGKV